MNDLPGERPTHTFSQVLSIHLVRVEVVAFAPGTKDVRKPDRPIIDQIDHPLFGERTPSQQITTRSAVPFVGIGERDIVDDLVVALDQQGLVFRDGLLNGFFELARKVKCGNGLISGRIAGG